MQITNDEKISILNNLKILKLASVKENYPPYGSYINSFEGIATTSDEISFISLNKKMPFDGYLNIFLFEDVLKVGKENISIEQPKDDLLYITFDNTNTTLNLASNLNMPFFSMPDVPLTSLDTEIINVLKSAINFVGAKIPYRCVYFGNGYICATDHGRVFLYQNDSIQNSPVALNKKIISFLTEAIQIGTHNSNIVLSWKETEDIAEGYGLFATDLLSGFPIDSIMSFVSGSKLDTKYLCNFAVIKDALNKIKSIFTGESNPILNIVNKNKKLTITGGSIVNGIMNAEYDSELEEECSIEISTGVLGSISIDYNVYIYPKLETDKLILNNDKSDIIVMGVE